MKLSGATLALRMLLDACNDENDEEVQEALDKLSDEIERGRWPDARVAATQFLGADEDTTESSPPAEDAESLAEDAWGDE